MKILLTTLLLLGLIVISKAGRECSSASDCGDEMGRTVCWSNTCYFNVPCNKDADCFFYGSASVPHFRCYVDPMVDRPHGYGTCIDESVADRQYEPLPTSNEIGGK